MNCLKQLTKGWLVFMAIVMPLFSMAQFPLSLDVNMPPPYPVKLSSYTDFDSRIFITVNNDSQEEQEIILTGSLTSRNRGLRIETDFNDLPTACILIPPGPGVTSLTGADLSEVFDPNHLIFAGTTADQILNDQALPEDRYTFCLRAYRCSGNGQLVALSDQPDLFQGCFDFEVAYVEPPEIISPICNTILPPYTQNIMFNWLFMPPETGYGGTVFKLKIVELDPIDVNPWDAMLSAPAIFETEVAANSYNLLVAIDGIFEDGKKYAYQVTANDLLGEIQFRNNGASQVCTFQYVAPPMETFRFDPVYPKPGDYIPFDFFPFIVRFTPYSDDYFYFEGDMQLRKNGSVVDEKHSLNNWNTYGPVRGQNKALTGDPDATMIGEWESRHLPVYKNATLSPHQFDKKEQYAWSFSGEMTLPSGGVLSNTLSNTEFNTGMSPSKLESPSNGATVAPGEIAFTWTTADKPVSLVPPFHIYQASATGQQVDINLFNGVVDERWVMEVAGTDTFESLVYSTDGRITGQYVDDSVSLINELYRQINTAHTITENGTYYWRVKWLSNTEDITSPAYRTSPVWSFTIGTPPAPVAVVEEDRPCVSECLTPARADRTAVSISVGQTLKMGKFDLVVSSISGGGGNTYSGEGEIPVAFMNNVKIKVEFSGLQANATQEVFAGTATAMEDAPSPSVTQITTIVDGMERIVPSFTALQADGISTLLESGDRLVSMISSGRPIGMPIGMDKEIEGGNFVIGIIEMEFTPTRASLMAMAQIDIPDLGEKLPAFGARDVCFSPSGFGDEYVLYLARDHEIAADGDFRFDFKGIESGDSTNASYIQFNCNGFKCATIRGEVTFPRNVLVPENTDGTIDETGFVTGTFSFKGCRGNNYMGEISFSPFEVPGLAGWGFAPGRAYYDWSDLENPPGMTFPSEYDTDLTAETINTWKGFYLTEATIHTPPEFQGEIAGRMSFSVSGIIGDNTGITGTLSANNIINYDDGQLEGWAFSLDRVHITLVQNNRLVAGGIEGKLGTPIFEEDDKLAYSALLGYNSSTEKVKFNFTVTPDENPLTVPMWGDAEMVFEPESSITIDFESGGDVVVTALLTGAIDITGDLGDLPEINFPGIQFQELRISTQVPKFDVSYFGLASPQKNVGGFPVNLRDLNIGLDMAGSGPGLVFDLKLNLQDAGFTAGAGFTIRSAMGISTRGLEKFELTGVELNSITVAQEISGINLNGSLTFFRDDADYGNGVQGSLTVGLPMGLEGRLNGMFGTKKNPSIINPRWNSADYFSYFYVDGEVILAESAAIQIFSGFAVYGFGGGVYHHMRQIPSTGGTAPRNDSGMAYETHFDTFLGLKVKAILGTYPKPDAFNMDVGLSIDFTDDGGILNVGIVGDGYIMAAISQREEAKVTAHVELNYDFPNETLNGGLNVYVKFEDYVYGGGANNLFVNASLHVDPTTWHFYMGTPADPASLIAGIGEGGPSLNLQSYLMVGHGIASQLPPLPPRIAALLSGGSLEAGAYDPVSDKEEINESATMDGKGFALGASLEVSTGKMNFAVFYAQLDMMLGFDVNVSQSANPVFCGGSGTQRGINNWYASGQLYAGLWGEMGVGVDLFFIKGDFPFINLAAAISMEGGLPNPTWFTGRAGLYYSVLGGMVEGYCNMTVEVGEKCVPMNMDPLGGDFIASINPSNGERNVDVFNYPAVSFNLPVNKVLEFPISEESPELGVRLLEGYIHKLDLINNTKGNSMVPGAYKLDYGKVVAQYEMTDALEGENRFTFDVEVRAREYLPGGVERQVRNSDGTLWNDRETVSFVTGERPQKILDENILFTYPFQNQAYFLKEEVHNGRGVLKYDGASSAYLFEPEQDDVSYIFYSRYIPVRGGEPITSGLYSRGSSGVEFGVPTNLANDEYYAVQLIRKRKKVISYSVVSPSIQESFNRAIGVKLEPLVKTLQNDAGTATVNLEGKELPGSNAMPGEDLLYKYYFKTSKYNNLRSKLASLNFSATHNTDFIENIELDGSTDEPFERSEFEGFKKGTRTTSSPLIGYVAPFNGTYHNTIANPRLYDVYWELYRIRNRRVIYRGWEFSYYVNLNFTFYNLPYHRQGLPPIKTVFKADDMYMSWPLSTYQLRNAAGIASDSERQMNDILTYWFATSNTSNESGYRFNLSYNTSMFVKLDRMKMMWTVSRLMANSTYSMAIQQNYPSLYNKLQSFLWYPVNSYNFTGGTYNVKVLYTAPGLSWRKTSEVNKQFFLPTYNILLRMY